MDEPAEQHAQQHEQPGDNANLPFQRNGLLAADDRQTGFDAGQGAALDVDDVGAACRQELLARLPIVRPAVLSANFRGTTTTG